MQTATATATTPRLAKDVPVALTIDDLHVHFQTDRGIVKAVDGVSFELKEGERFGLVGESGSGKSTTALSIMRMIKPPGQIVAGKILLHGKVGTPDLVQLSPEQVRQLRLSSISLIPQGSMNSLNPVRRVRDHFEDSILAHEPKTNSREIRERAAELLGMVGLSPDVEKLYPHELSGGMKQRVCIALAISLQPRIILADEPTSALDVVVQRRIMETLASVQQKLSASVLLVGHDMGLLAQFVDRLGVMYAGKLVEVGTIHEIFSAPKHPYTQMLIASLPTLAERGVFRGVPGIPPSLLNAPSGCLFYDRCPKHMDICKTITPLLADVAPGQQAACHLYPQSTPASS
ncbi:MAG: ABC transporter ATP-binding protein [Thermomicrobiales bacterium]